MVKKTMKLLLENWREYLNENVSETQVQYVLSTANAFLDELDYGHIDAIYLIGSQASGKARENSDWDYLVVGDGFNEVEDERIARADIGNPFSGLDIDVAVDKRSEHIDIIFSSTPPPSEQASKKVYPIDEGAK